MKRSLNIFATLLFAPFIAGAVSSTPDSTEIIQDENLEMESNPQRLWVVEANNSVYLTYIGDTNYAIDVSNYLDLSKTSRRYEMNPKSTAARPNRLTNPQLPVNGNVYDRDSSGRYHVDRQGDYPGYRMKSTGVDVSSNAIHYFEENQMVGALDLDGLAYVTLDRDHHIQSGTFSPNRPLFWVKGDEFVLTDEATGEVYLLSTSAHESRLYLLDFVFGDADLVMKIKGHSENWTISDGALSYNQLKNGEQVRIEAKIE